MRLLTHELRKVWGKPVFLAGLLALALCNLFLLWTGTRPGTGQPPAAAYKAAGRALEGLTTAQQQALVEEKLDLVRGVLQINQLLRYAAEGGTLADDPRKTSPALFEQYGDAYEKRDYILFCDTLVQEYQLLEALSAELKAVGGYDAFLDSVQQKAQTLAGISIFKTAQSGYEQQNIALTARAYEGLRAVPITYSPQKGLYTTLEYPFTDAILLLGMALLASLLVREERDSGLLAFVRSTAGGRRRTALAKLAALALSLLAVLCLLYGVNLAYCQGTFGLGGLDRTIQSVPALMRCTMPLTVRQYLGLFLLAKWGATFALGAGVMLAALWARRAVAGFAGALALFGAQWGIRALIPATARLNVLKYANLVSLLRTNELLGNYRNLYWFGRPVQLPLVECVAAAVFCAVFCGGFCWLMTFAQLPEAPQGLPLLRLVPRRTKNSRATTVWREERFKLLALGGGGAALVLFVLLQCHSGFVQRPYLTADDLLYRAYMQRFAGPYTAQTRAALEEEQQRFLPLLEAQAAMAAGKMSFEEYNVFLASHYSLNAAFGVFGRIVNGNLAYLQQHPGAQLVYEPGYEYLFGLHDEADDETAALLAGLVCAVCCCGLCALEHKSGMRALLAATPLGRRATLRAKLAGGVLAAALAGLAACLPRFITALHTYGLPAPGAPACSLQAFAGVPPWVPLAGLLLLSVLARVMACLAVCTVALAFSQKLGSAMGALFCAGALFCLPLLLALSGLSGIQWFSFYPLFHAPALLAGAGGGALLVLYGGMAALLTWAAAYYLLDCGEPS